MNHNIFYQSEKLTKAKFLGDSVIYQQVLFNVLTNAFQHSEHNGNVGIYLTANYIERNKVTKNLDFDEERTILSVIV